MSTTPTPRPRLSASERMAIIQNQANQPISCIRCGSQWFTDVSFQQYSGSQYSSTPGGDLQVISHLTHRIRVCLCGHPVAPNIGGVRPGRTAATEVTSFLESFHAAKAYLASIGQIDPEVIANDFPTRDEYQKVVEQLEQLQEKVAAVQTLTAPSTTTAESADTPASTEDTASEPAAQSTRQRAGRFTAKNPTAGGDNGK